MATTQNFTRDDSVDVIESRITLKDDEEEAYAEEKRFILKLNEIINISKEKIDNLFVNYPFAVVKNLSRQERVLYNAPTLAYGEVTFDSFAEIFRLLYKHGFEKDDTLGMKFYDIGSGSGRLV